MIDKYPLDGFVFEYMQTHLTISKFNLVLDAFNIMHYLNINDKGNYVELIDLEGYLQNIYNKDDITDNLDILTMRVVNETLKDRLVSTGILIDDDVELDITIDIAKSFYNMLGLDASVKNHYIEVLNNTEISPDEQFVLLLNEYTDNNYMTIYEAIRDIVLDYIVDSLYDKEELTTDDRVAKLIKYDQELQSNYIISSILNGSKEITDTESEYTKYISMIEDWYNPIDIITDIAVIGYLTHIDDNSEFVYEYIDSERIVEAINYEHNSEYLKQKIYELLNKFSEEI